MTLDNGAMRSAMPCSLYRLAFLCCLVLRLTPAWQQNRPRTIHSPYRQPRHYSNYFFRLSMAEQSGAPTPDAQTTSKITQIWKGISLVRTAAQTVQKHQNETKPSTSTPTTGLPEWLEPLLQGGIMTKAQRRRLRTRRRLQRNPAFAALTNWAFDKCDAAGDGRINRDELYAGILLVHLHLAKYVGVTACNPLNRTEVHELFDLAAQQDAWSIVDGRQTIGRDAFGEIVVLSCAKIASQIVVYYTLLVVLVPFLTRRIIGLWQQGLQGLKIVGKWGGWRNRIAMTITSRASSVASSSWMVHAWALAEWTVQHLLSVVMVTTVMPWIFLQLQQRAPAWIMPGGRRPYYSFLGNSMQKSTKETDPNKKSDETSNKQQEDESKQKQNEERADHQT